MNKVSVIKAITKLYFAAAVAGSATHIIHAAGKTGLHGWEMYTTPLLIDGLAIIGLIMRGDDFSKRNQTFGFRVQCIMGLLSLIANVYAAESAGGVMYGVAIVLMFIGAEWLSSNIESADVDKAAEVADKRKAAAAKGAATRAANKAKATAKTRRTTTPKHLKAV